MRRYSIGAFLLDRDDPTRIIGRLKDPLVTPAEQGAQGYVPNVVYSCGSLIHDDRLFLPYAVSDSFSRVAAIPLDALVREITDNGP